MCPTDDSHLTLEFDDHFVIRPTIKFTNRGNDFTVNEIDEKGIPVDEGFEYNSGTNTRFLSIDEIMEFNQHSEDL